jgi:hypothetical protein
MVDNIRNWANVNLAVSSILADDAQRPVLIGLHNRARNTSSFARMLRNVLEKMAMPRPRGHFVKLLSVREVLAVCANEDRGCAPSCTFMNQHEDDDADVRVIRVT